MQAAVSNWELYESARPCFTTRECQGLSAEAYVDFLAGLALGDKASLGGTPKPDLLIVREKQLPESRYVELFTGLWEKVHSALGREHAKNDFGQGTAVLIPHTYPAAAFQTGCGWLHLPFPLFLRYQKEGGFSRLKIGTSVHSAAEARQAQELGAAYVTAGHIFATDCKKGAPPRRTEFLEQVCASVSIPVFAIGGIHRGNIDRIRGTQAAGACMMSEYMRASVHCAAEPYTEKL